jgi:putative membrane protein
MKRTVSRLGIAMACATLLAGPAAAQGTGSATEAPTPEQHGGSGQSGDATDQKGSTHGDQVGAEDQTERPGERGTSGRPTGTSGDVGAEAESGASLITDDRSFIVRAAAGSMAEVRFGHLAADKAAREEVKQFAQRMIDDHATLNEELMTVARDLELMAPHAMRPEDLEAYERISALTGAEFDRAFIQHVVQDHRQNLQLFRQHAQRAEHDGVKRFAQSKLPLLEQHYQRALELQQQVSGDGTSGTSGTPPQ